MLPDSERKSSVLLLTRESTLSLQPKPRSPTRDRLLYGPVHGRLTDDDRQRRLLLYLFMTVGIPLLLIFGAGDLLEGDFTEAAGDLGSVGVLVIAALVLRRLPDGRPVFIAVTAVIAMHLGSLFVAGGEAGEKGVWLFILPGLAHFLCGQSVGMICSVVGLVTAVAISLGSGIEPYTPQLFVRLIAAYVMIMLMTHFYERIRDRSIREANQASAAKDRFLATVSHELRTPMNGVLGMAGLLVEESEPESTERDYATTIKRSAESMVVILDDIFDLAKVDQGQIELQRASFDPVQLVADVVALLAPTACQKRIGLRPEVGDCTSQELMGDADRLRQVLLNLAGNAVKFTERGEVTIELSTKPLGGAVDATFAVRDTGPGIPHDQRDDVFDPFVKLDPAASGSGLGLPISRRLVRQMGGELTVESALRQGSVFRFAICLEAASAAEEQPAATLTADPVTLKPLRILVAEDDPISQRVVRRLLEKRGHLVQVVGDGREVIRVLEIERFDAILMDVQMPVLDGLDATRRIRASTRVKDPRVPIVAMTAYAMKGDRERCLAAGMTGYITKPVSAGALLGALAETVDQRVEGSRING